MAKSLPDIGSKQFKIYRVPSNADDYDPCAGVEFAPTRGSDELFEALKTVYTHGKTHRSRIREAVIEFLWEEYISEDPCAAAQTLCRLSELNQILAPREEVQHPIQNVDSQKRSASLGSSNWLRDYTSDVASDDVRINRRFLGEKEIPLRSIGGESMVHRARTHIATLAPELSVDVEEHIPGKMMNVFCISEVPSARKYARRRGMTETEKKEYSRLRRVGACSTCKQHKRKCAPAHTQHEYEASTYEELNTSSKPSPTLPGCQLSNSGKPSEGALIHDHKPNPAADSSTELLDDDINERGVNVDSCPPRKRSINDSGSARVRRRTSVVDPERREADPAIVEDPAPGSIEIRRASLPNTCQQGTLGSMAQAALEE